LTDLVKTACSLQESLRNKISIVEEEAAYFKLKYAETAKALMDVTQKFKLFLQESNKSTTITPPSPGNKTPRTLKVVTKFPKLEDRSIYEEPRIDMREIDNIEQRSPEMFVKRAINDTKIGFGHAIEKQFSIIPTKCTDQ
jgi:hypothetical protein